MDRNKENKSAKAFHVPSARWHCEGAESLCQGAVTQCSKRRSRADVRQQVKRRQRPSLESRKKRPQQRMHMPHSALTTPALPRVTGDALATRNEDGSWRTHHKRTPHGLKVDMLSSASDLSQRTNTRRHSSMAEAVVTTGAAKALQLLLTSIDEAFLVISTCQCIAGGLESCQGITGRQAQSAVTATATAPGARVRVRASAAGHV